MLDPLQAVLRLALSAALGSLIGWERERHGRAAGLRTHMLLAMGCTLVTLVSFSVAGGSAGYDPGRIASSVMTGIGFLGAGVIIRQGINVLGLTTAASIWVTAGIGLAVGAGLYIEAVGASVLTVAVLIPLRALEARLVRKEVRESLKLDFEGAAVSISAVKTALAAYGIEIRSYGLTRGRSTAGSEKPERLSYELVLKCPDDVELDAATTALMDTFRGSGLVRASWT